MQENMIKTMLLATNLCLWASGWAVLAVGVHLMSGENGRHYAIMLLGKTHPGTDVPPPFAELEGGRGGGSTLGDNNAASAEPPGHTKTPLSRPTSRNSSSPADLSFEEMGEATESMDVKLEATLLVLGSVVVMAGLVGCIAASQNDRTLLLAYCLLMIVVGLGDGGAGIWCFCSASHNLGEVSIPSGTPLAVSSSSPLSSASVDDPLQRFHQWYGSADHITYTEALNSVQEQLACCGMTGPNDYVTSYWHHVYSPGKTVLPPSCCFRNLSSSAASSFADVQCEGTYTWPHLQGCLEIMPSMIASDYFRAGTILIIVSILQISGASATLVLRKQIKTMTCGELPPLETVLF